MSDIIEEITNLTDEWYHLIGKDHHKDRDCHWYIETKWSYGFPPKYLVCHYGYLVDEIEEECDSHELALARLKDILTEEIKQYRIYQTNDDEEAGW
jgi:hypothetical protein